MYLFLNLLIYIIHINRHINKYNLKYKYLISILININTYSFALSFEDILFSSIEVGKTTDSEHYKEFT